MGLQCMFSPYATMCWGAQNHFLTCRLAYFGVRLANREGWKIISRKKTNPNDVCATGILAKGGSESEPSVSARANEQASRACLFAKKEEQRHERVLIFCKKIGASDIKLAPTWCEW